MIRSYKNRYRNMHKKRVNGSYCGVRQLTSERTAGHKASLACTVEEVTLVVQENVGRRRCNRKMFHDLELLLLLLSSSSSSSASSSSPLCRVFILILLRQTMSLGNTVLQLFCCSYSWCLYR